MARTYGELVELVRDWSNRDIQVLGDGIIQDSLKYAADKAYRVLRIPPLEEIVTYNSAALIAATTPANNLLPSHTEIVLPADLIEIIQIREIDANNSTTKVFNQKVDIRTFNDFSSDIGQFGSYWSRQKNNVILAPGFNANSIGSPTGVEIYYYKRLPAIDASYKVSSQNYTAGFLTEVDTGTNNAESLYFVTQNNVTTVYDTLAAAQATGGTVVTTEFLGQLVPNWLRDENERILLNGALAEVFFYLQDEEQSVKYATLFKQEIEELNDEDNKRNARGGNIQTNFNGSGLI